MKIPKENLLNIYRDFALFDWSSKYCPQARFLLKIDDFVFLNPFLLIKFLHGNQNDRFNLASKPSLNIFHHCSRLNTRLPYVYGFLHTNQPVLRAKTLSYNGSENFIITHDEYPCKIYPNYLNDHLYLISSDARDLLLCTFYYQSNQFFPLSNIYITGILSEYLNIERQVFPNYQSNFYTKISCEEFFQETNPFQAFACVDLSGNFFLYWQIIINSQLENK